MNEYIINVHTELTKTDLDTLTSDELADLLVDLHLQINQLTDYVEGRLEERS